MLGDNGCLFLMNVIWYVLYICSIVSDFFHSDCFISENKKNHVIKDSTIHFKVKRDKMSLYALYVALSCLSLFITLFWVWLSHWVSFFINILTFCFTEWIFYTFPFLPSFHGCFNIPDSRSTIQSRGPQSLHHKLVMALWPVRNQATQQVSSKQARQASSVFITTPHHLHYCLSSNSCQISSDIRFP